MRHSRRNIPDAISPQNPLNKTDITNDRIQDHLEEKTSMEEILSPDEEEKKKQDEILNRQNDHRSADDDLRRDKETGL